MTRNSLTGDEYAEDEQRISAETGVDTEVNHVHGLNTELRDIYQPYGTQNQCIDRLGTSFHYAEPSPYSGHYDFSNPHMLLISHAPHMTILPSVGDDAHNKKRRRTNYREPKCLAALTAAVKVLTDRGKDGRSLGMKVVAREHGIPYNTLRDNYLKAISSRPKRLQPRNIFSCESDGGPQPARADEQSAISGLNCQ